MLVDLRIAIFSFTGRSTPPRWRRYMARTRQSVVECWTARLCEDNYVRTYCISFNYSINVCVSVPIVIVFKK